jgi:hypothetical protein
MALLVLLALCDLPGVRNAVVTFTGNITTDFHTDYFSLTDTRDLFVESGFDIREVVFSYDRASDTGYFGAWLLVRGLGAGPGRRVLAPT